jgi:hypothetical protein
VVVRLLQPDVQEGEQGGADLLSILVCYYWEPRKHYDLLCVDESREPMAEGATSSSSSSSRNMW